MFNIFLQLCLAALCYAAPIADETLSTMDSTTQYGAGGGIVGFIVLVLDILVWSESPSYSPTVIRSRADQFIVEVLKSSRPVSHKLLWSVLVFIFPIGGIVIYWLLSDRQKWNNGNGYEAIAEETR
jgi:hypothetical protein